MSTAEDHTVSVSTPARQRAQGRALVHPRTRRGIGKGLIMVAATIIVVWSVFPIYWMVISAFRTQTALFAPQPTLVPGPFSIDFFKSLLSMSNYAVYYRNSLIVSVVTTLVTIVSATMMGYVLARYVLPGISTLLKTMLIAYMLPPLLVAIPLLGIFVWIGIDDTLLAVILGHVSMALPFSVWLLWSFFKTVPFEVEESAMVDGATRIQALRHVTLPLALPGIVTVTIFSFIVSWTDYTYALLLVSSDKNMTVTIGLATFLGGFEMYWGQVMAGATLIALPMIVAFAFISRYFIRGLTAGAVKG